MSSKQLLTEKSDSSSCDDYIAEKQKPTKIVKKKVLLVESESKKNLYIHLKMPRNSKIFHCHNHKKLLLILLGDNFFFKNA